MKTTPEEFAFWLQGYVEINGNLPDEVQWAVIVNKLGTVFNKQTPLYFGPLGPLTPPSTGPLIKIC